MKVLVASPAYGRTYQSYYTMEHAWKTGKDFRIDGGPYFSIRNLEELRDLGYDRIIITCGEIILSVVTTEEVAA